jgi:hypothetical protein
MPLPQPYLEDIGSTAELHQAIAAIMGSQIGKYSYKINGVAHAADAIYVVENRDTDPPREWGRSGIEILVYEPKIGGHNYLGVTGLDQIFEIKVIQHDRSTTLNTAKSALLVGLPMLLERSHLGINNQDDEELNLYQVQTHLG